MKKRIGFILVLSVLLACSDSFGQAKRFSMSISPMHFFSGSAKLEAEVRPGKLRNSFSIAPQYFFSNMSEVFSPLTGVEEYTFSGYGLDLQHKIFLNKVVDSIDQYDWRAYFSYGAAYYTFENRYTRDVWYPYEYDGLNYITYGEQDMTDFIDRWKFSILTGVQKRTGNFLFEAYGGMSYQVATVDAEYVGLVDYDSSFWKYGFSGYVPRVGFKIGAFLF